MSDNKNKFWEFTTTTIVKAPTKSAAEAALFSPRRKRTENAEVLATVVMGDRIPAADAHAWVSAAN